jgi:pimeloyl-ACP methyl ester carboxylesterase
MIRRIAFHQLYLLGRKTPQQVEAARPELAGIWRTIRGGAEAPPHYGRPYAWHWQAAQKNFLAAWAATDAPVLVAYASYDQFEPRASHKVIVDTVNRLRPGTARLLALNGLDHSLYRYPDEFAAYREEGGVPGREELLVPLIAWLKGKAR